LFNGEHTMILKLTAKTHKGKNIITNYGDLWHVEHLNFKTNILIKSIKNPKEGLRWIKHPIDPDFEVSKILEDGT